MRLHALASVACLSLASLAAGAAPAQATPYVVIEADTGRVVSEQEATSRWYPASLTKLVTLYVALQAVQEGRVSLQTPLVVSLRANKAPPSKMGFKPGTEVTLGNALKMLMVKSANDIAITIAEGLGGSVEDFATMMNATAVRLGMRESHFVNPNGLHSDEHFSSARDMALIAYALYRDFDQYSGFFGIGALRLEDQIIPTHNGLLGRYPGAEGMKTGFTCPAGFNVVASASRGNRRLIAVVLGYPNAKARSFKAASLLDAGFASYAKRTTIDALPAVRSEAPNMRARVCGPNRDRVAEDDFAAVAGQAPENERAGLFSAQGSSASGVAVLQSQMGTRPAFEPEEVYVGRAPGYMGPSLSARTTYVATAVGAAATAAMVTKPRATPAKASKGKPAAKAKGKPKNKAR